MVRAVLAAPFRFGEIVAGLAHEDLLVRMRCADVAEKVSKEHPDWLQSHKRKLLELADRPSEQELRWHLAQMLPRLDLTSREHRRVEAIMLDYLQDKSRIVQVSALQGLADLSSGDPKLRRRLLVLLQDLRRSAGPAVRVRARKLLARLKP